MVDRQTDSSRETIDEKLLSAELADLIKRAKDDAAIDSREEFLNVITRRANKSFADLVIVGICFVETDGEGIS